MAKRTAPLTYHGRHRDGVNIGRTGERIHVRWGETVDFDAELAAQLCEEQPTEFSIEAPAKKSAGKKAGTSTAPEEG